VLNSFTAIANHYLFASRIFCGTDLQQSLSQAETFACPNSPSEKTFAKQGWFVHEKTNGQNPRKFLNLTCIHYCFNELEYLRRR